VSAADPLFYENGENQNPHRLMRALEVMRGTNRSIISFKKGGSIKRPFNIIKIFIDLPREVLYTRINERVDTMMSNGLYDEVKELIPFKHLNALQTVGYKELFEYFDGNLSLNDAVENIKKNTRHYAKRQNTWFKKDEDYNICPPDLNAVKKIIRTSLLQ
jgi:tRNA dimethylallyltransferase